MRPRNSGFVNVVRMISTKSIFIFATAALHCDWALRLMHPEFEFSNESGISKTVRTPHEFSKRLR